MGQIEIDEVLQIMRQHFQAYITVRGDHKSHQGTRFLDLCAIG